MNTIIKMKDNIQTHWRDDTGRDISSFIKQKTIRSSKCTAAKNDGLTITSQVCEMWKLTWDSFVAPVITDDTLGLAAHQAIASWDSGTPNSSAIGFRPLTFFSTSSTSDLLARFCNTKIKKLLSTQKGGEVHNSLYNSDTTIYLDKVIWHTIRKRY